MSKWIKTATLVATTETGLGVALLAEDRSDLTPHRTGRKSDLFSRTRDGQVHEVSLKRVAMCPVCTSPVTSKAHKAHA
jgi:hypothetical protein